MQHKQNRRSSDGTDRDKPEMVVPQYILDCIRSALSPFKISWDKIQDAILSQGQEEQQAGDEKETFLSTEDVSKMLHVSRTTLHRYKAAGKIRVFKLGRRNLYSSKEIRAALKSEKGQDAVTGKTEPEPTQEAQFEF